MEAVLEFWWSVALASGDFLAFSGGRKSDDMPALIGRPISFFLFALVANPDAGVRDLSLARVKDIYAGKVTNWKGIGGTDLPIHLITRHRGSGTRAASPPRRVPTSCARTGCVRAPNWRTRRGANPGE